MRSFSLGHLVLVMVADFSRRRTHQYWGALAARNGEKKFHEAMETRGNVDGVYHELPGLGVEEPPLAHLEPVHVRGPRGNVACRRHALLEAVTAIFCHGADGDYLNPSMFRPVVEASRLQIVEDHHHGSNQPEHFFGGKLLRICDRTARCCCCCCLGWMSMLDASRASLFLHQSSPASRYSTICYVPRTS